MEQPLSGAFMTRRCFQLRQPLLPLLALAPCILPVGYPRSVLEKALTRMALAMSSI